MVGGRKKSRREAENFILNFPRTDRDNPQSFMPERIGTFLMMRIISTS